MHLEDALVGCSLGDGLAAAAAPAFCRELIANGCDIVACAPERADVLAAIAPICREEDAILLMTGLGASGDDCHGVLLENGAGELGVARAVAGEDAILGSRVGSANDAALALELGVGFLLYSGVAPVAMVGALPGAVGVPLFVGGQHDIAAVDGGRYRFWVEASVGMDAPAAVRACSKAVGRVI